MVKTTKMSVVITAIAILIATIIAVISFMSPSPQQVIAQSNVTQEANQTGEQMQSGMANTTQEARSSANQTGEKVQSIMNKTREGGQSMMNKTGETVQSFMNQTGETLQKINPLK